MAEHIIHTVTILQTGAGIDSCSGCLWYGAGIVVIDHYVLWETGRRERGRREGRGEGGGREVERREMGGRWEGKGSE